MARYGCTIEVDTGKIPSSQSDFAWLATEDNFPAAAIDGGGTSILNGGGNLRCYTDSTKATQLPIEVVSFVTGGTPSVQVRGLSPTLNVASTVYIEADTVATTQPAVGAAFGRNAVWPSSSGIYHLEDTTTNSSGGTSLTEVGTVTSISGEIGGGQSNGSNSDYLDTGLNSVIADGAISIWINPNDVSGFDYIVSDRSTLPDADPYFQILTVNAQLNIRVNGTAGAQVATGNVLTAGVWQLIDVTWGSDGVKVYVNAILEGSNAYTGTWTPNSNLQLGHASAWDNPYLGGMDECEIKTTQNSQDYIEAKYNNQSSPSTFWTTGAWEDQDDGGITVTVNETGPSFTESINTNLSVNITGNIAESGPSFTESISANVSSITTINGTITESGPSFTESINANLDVNLSATIAELGPSFTESINVNITTEIDANITEFGPSFSENINVTIPIKIAVNPKNLVRVKRKSNTVRIKRKSNTIRVR